MWIPDHAYIVRQGKTDLNLTVKYAVESALPGSREVRQSMGNNENSDLFG